MKTKYPSFMIEYKKCVKNPTTPLWFCKKCRAGYKTKQEADKCYDKHKNGK